MISNIVFFKADLI